MSAPDWELDLDRLNQDDPFEVDQVNAAHLAKHDHFATDDLYDAFADNPIFVGAPHEPALWLMIAEIPGDIVIIPLMRARNPTQVRPIGIYRANTRYRKVFRDAWR
ncbi:MAG TPA: hypothetical protein VNQ73_00030 [Ilumatobacter sp.]|nr:hypothetical protein [Ilumatobacter sp.]